MRFEELNLDGDRQRGWSALALPYFNLPPADSAELCELLAATLGVGVVADDLARHRLAVEDEVEGGGGG